MNYNNLNDADYAWLDLGRVSEINIEQALIPRSDQDVEQPGMDLMKVLSKPENLALAAKLILNVQLLPEQAVILEQLWTHAFPMYTASRGFGKSYMLAVYAILRCVLCPGTKVVIVGAAFRQSKIIFEYMETVWQNAPVLQSIFTNDSGPRHDTDRYTFHFRLGAAISLEAGKSMDSWATAVPLGDGSKIRGLRAHVIIADEFSSIPPDIYETVVAGFAAVSSDPLANVQEIRRRQFSLEADDYEWTTDEEEEFQGKTGNQAILSGTASYDFQHFADYWKRYCGFIKSRGDEKIIKDLLNEEVVPKSFNWKDYCVIRIPYELIPEGFMDDKQVTRAKATVNSAIYNMEYGAVFESDSDGFFKRSVIERCVASDTKPVPLPSGEVWFDARLYGSSGLRYVYGIDPASEKDNFSIVILELHEEHTRIVYSWSTNRTDFKRRLQAGLANKYDFYGFCARKIRDLMKVFPCEAIALDGQGGGVAVEEALHDPDKMEAGEVAIWPVIDPDKEKDTDIHPGLHILHICQFAKADWTGLANHGLRKDFEDRVLLFPQFDPISLALSAEDDKHRKNAWERQNPDQKFNIYDTLEDCVMELEELKDELCTISITRTGTGVNSRDRWDTPEVKMPNGKKGRLRKDRYSSLVMANMIARELHRAPPPVEYKMVGNFANNIQQGQKGNMYQGPDWFVQGMNSGTVFGVVRK